MKSKSSNRQSSDSTRYKKSNNAPRPSNQNKSHWKLNKNNSSATDNELSNKKKPTKLTIKKQNNSKYVDQNLDQSTKKFTKRKKDILIIKPIKSKVRKPLSNEVRLNKFVANSGICSRREADELIKAGVVTVNGKVIIELGAKVKLSDDIRFNGERLQGEKKVYILLNKPKGYVTTLEDPHADKTVMELIEGACNERVYPVGRLDKNTTGVLLFTNDGELTKQLTHPSSGKSKVYHVFLDKNVSKNDLIKLVEGFDLEDGFIQADSAEFADDKDKKQIGIEIHSGRNRIIRRMFEHLGYKVMKLDRVYFAGLTKKRLKRGEWRVLTPKEVNILKMGSFK